MSSLSIKRIRFYFLLSAAIAALYLILDRQNVFIYRIIDSLFIGSMIPLIIGGFRLAKYMGSFDLLVYTHRKLWKYGTRHEKFEEENEAIAPNSIEKPGTYADYLGEKKSVPAFKEPLLIGGIFFFAALILALIFF